MFIESNYNLYFVYPQKDTKIVEKLYLGSYVLWDWRHVRASSWCHISSLDIVFFFAVINSEELTYFKISKVPCSNSQTQFIITFTIEVGVIKFVVIVIFGLTFAWGMLFRSEIQWCYRDFTRQTVILLHLKCVLVVSSIIVRFNAF